MHASREADVQIIGGGMVGVLIALLAAEQGRRVVLYRMSDSNRPNADSLRNHAWLQSGLWYARHQPIEFVLRMYWAGMALFDLFGLPRPSQRGVFRVANESEAASFLVDAARLRLGSKVERIRDLELQGLLGTLYHPGQPCFWVPDVPFPEAAIMSAARNRARDSGAKLYDLKIPVGIFDEPSATGGLLVKVDREIVESPIVVIAAGAGTPALLDQLNLNHSLRVFQSPLCVVDRSAALDVNVPLFCDCATGLTVAHHNSTIFPPNGRLVIGNGHRRPLEDTSPMWDRRLDNHDVDSIARLLPGVTQDQLIQMGARFTAGRKTEPHDAGVRRSIEPWCQCFDKYKGLIAAVPVKATMALATADTVMQRIDELFPAPSRAVTSEVFELSDELPSWEDSVYLHHESYYDRLNDAEVSTEHSRADNI